MEAGLPCPASVIVKSRDEALAAFDRMNPAAVLKPLSGSGSELVFLCKSKKECTEAFNLLANHLSSPACRRMYAPVANTDPKTAFLMESYKKGTEYSCDFILEKGRIDILRLARKIPAVGHPFGTTLAYVLPASRPPVDDLEEILFEGAEALGFTRALCMVDFLVHEDEIELLEMTPRPGGDCLPDLMLTSSGFDILGAALDFAEGKKINPPPEDQWQRLVGVRFIAGQAGTIAEYDVSELKEDFFVLEYRLKYRPGHGVVLPPDDYDSRILGHVIFEPSGDSSIEVEAPEIADKLKVIYESES
jgi:biotin carboxylase